MRLTLHQPLEDLRDLRDCCARDVDQYMQAGDPLLRTYVAETRIVLALVNAEIAARCNGPTQPRAFFTRSAADLAGGT